MSEKETQTLHRFINGTMRHIENAANYLLFYKEANNSDENDSHTNEKKDDKGYYFSEGGLARRYYREDRRYNIFSVSGARTSDPESEDYTDTDWMENKSFRSGYFPYNPDEFSNHVEEKDFWNKVQNQLNDEEIRIAISIIRGYKKADIIRLSNLSEAKLRTRLKRIGEKLYSEKYSNLMTSTKTCYNCGESKTIFEFGKDKRNRDGLRSWCRECTNVSRRKKNLENCV